MPAEPPATPLRKFTLHPPTLVAPASVLTLAHSTSQPFTTQSLAALRTALLSSRTLAAERIAVKDANRRNLSERQAVLNRVLEETQRVKEVERKKKREEEERKDKERRLLHEKANEGMQLDEPVVSMGTAPVKPIAQKPAVLPPAPPAALPSNLNGDIASRVDPLAATKQRIASSSAASTPLPTPTPIHAISSAPGSIPASVANSISAVPSPRQHFSQYRTVATADCLAHSFSVCCYGDVRRGGRIRSAKTAESSEEVSLSPCTRTSMRPCAEEDLLTV